MTRLGLTRRSPLVALALAAALAPGCAVGPNYTIVFNLTEWMHTH